MKPENVIAEKTRDAYSFKCKYYSLREWTRIIRFLLDNGYTELATEEILYSKYMRWAYDSTVGQGDGVKVTLEKFEPYFEKERKGIDKMLVDEFKTSRWYL